MDTLLDVFLGLNRRARVVIVVLLIAVAIAAVVYFQSQQRRQTASTNPSAEAALSPNLLLGNPSSATSDPASRANYLMVKPYYALSYNDALGTANWVTWRVTTEDLGDAPRKPTFDTDMTLPSAFYHVTHKDYSGSGFDRGHLCPHSDRAATREMSFATFIMSNIIPQAPNVNQKAWAELEMYCRDLARRHNHLYIIAGPTGRGGRGSNGFKNAIAGGRVTVPSECWKIIVVVPENGEDDLGKIGPATRVITVIMPNDNDAVGEEWAKFRTSAAEVETRTGLKFFDRLSDGIAQMLREKVDAVSIAPPRPLGHGG
jgi:endonuclease G